MRSGSRDNARRHAGREHPEARRLAVDPSRHVVLEASAGTGKTSVLVSRYVNLLDAGVDPANILAMTFTRKAAAHQGRGAARRVLHRIEGVAPKERDAIVLGYTAVDVEAERWEQVALAVRAFALGQVGVAQHHRAEARDQRAQARVQAPVRVVDRELDRRLEGEREAEMAEPEGHAERRRVAPVVALDARRVVRDRDPRLVGDAGEPAFERRLGRAQQAGQVPGIEAQGHPIRRPPSPGADTLIEYLMEQGANINVKNGCGQTPLSLAMRTSAEGLTDNPEVSDAHESTTELLLALGASYSVLSDPVGECVLGRAGLQIDIEREKKIQKLKQGSNTE